MLFVLCCSALSTAPTPGFSPLIATGQVHNLPYPCGPSPVPLPHLAAFQQQVPVVLSPRSPAIALTPPVYRLPEARTLPFSPTSHRRLSPDIVLQVPLVPTNFAPVHNSALPMISAAVAVGSPAQPAALPSPSPLGGTESSGVLDLSSKRQTLSRDHTSQSLTHQMSADDSPMDSSYPSSVDSPPSRHEEHSEERLCAGSDVTTTCQVTSDIGHWGIEEVVNFVSSVPGCQDYAEVGHAIVRVSVYCMSVVGYVDGEK